MKKITAFSGSLSSSSINEQFLAYIKNHYQLRQINIVDLKSLDIPTYSPITEQHGFPEGVQKLNNEIASNEVILIATPEHNGNMTGHLKSTLDWLSRIHRDFLKDKPVFIVGTSPGRSGAVESIENVRKFVIRLGGNFIDSYSLPSFGHAFENGELIEEHAETLNAFVVKLKSS